MEKREKERERERERERQSASFSCSEPDVVKINKSRKREKCRQEVSKRKTFLLLFKIDLTQFTVLLFYQKTEP